MENLKSKVMSWEATNNKLSKCIGRDVMTLDKIDKIPSTYVRESIKVSNWESLSDVEILGFIDVDQYINSYVYIITDVSYFDSMGVFEVSVDNIYEFMKLYADEYSECFFNGDVIIINPNYKEILTFQHSGFWLKFNIPLPPRE